MQPAIYEKDSSYIQSQTTIEAKVAAIDAIVDALMTQALTLAQQGEPVTEFMLNDGQTIIKAVYRSPEQVYKSIEVLEKLRNYYTNTGRRNIRMINWRNLIGRRQS